MDDRIELAEWQGWTVLEPLGGEERIGFPPEKEDCGKNFIGPLPNPVRNASHCDDLIEFLGSHGYGTDIYRRPWMERHSVVVYVAGRGTGLEWRERRWEGDDYKQGVVALALKIKRQE